MKFILVGFLGLGVFRFEIKHASKVRFHFTFVIFKKVQLNVGCFCFSLWSSL